MKKQGKKAMVLKRWNQILNHPSSKKIEEKKKVSVANMLENQYRYIHKTLEGLNEDLAGGNMTGTADVNTYDSVLIPLLRRVAPDLIALDILGTQPMEKPTQLIFAMRSHYAGNDAATNDFPLPGAKGNRLPYDQQPNSGAQQYYEIVQVNNISAVNPDAYYNVGDVLANDWTGGAPTKYALVLYVEKDLVNDKMMILIERLDSAQKSHRQTGAYNGTATPFFTKSDKIVPFIADPNWGAEPIVFFDLPDESMYNAVLQSYSGTYATDVSEKMGKEINQMNFSIDKVTVTARTRILKARYSFEVAEDLKAFHGIDADT